MDNTDYALSEEKSSLFFVYPNIILTFAHPNVFYIKTILKRLVVKRAFFCINARNVEINVVSCIINYYLCAMDIKKYIVQNWLCDHQFGKLMKLFPSELHYVTPGSDFPMYVFKCSLCGKYRIIHCGGKIVEPTKQEIEEMRNLL